MLNLSAHAREHAKRAALRSLIIVGALISFTPVISAEPTKTYGLKALSDHGNTCRVDKPMNQAELVKLALICNPQQQAVDARWRASQHRIKGAGSLDDPHFSIVAAPQTFDNDNTDTGFIAEFRQPIPWPGVLSLRADTARAAANAQQTRIDQHALGLARNVRYLYAQWQYHSRLLNLNQRHQTLWQENIAITEAKYASGYSGKSELLQARQEYFLRQREVLELKANVERDESQLRSLLNLPPDTQLELGQALPDELVPIPASVVQSLFGGIETLPQMRELTAQRQQKANELALAEKDRYPSFNFITRYNRLRFNHDQRWLVGFSVNLPFDFGKRSSRESSIRAEQEALRWQQEQTHGELHESLVQAYSLWRQAHEVNTLYQSDLLPLADESLVTARDEYQSGTSDFLSLLTAQHQALDTQRQSEQAIRDQFIQQANLTAAAGFLWFDEWQGNTQTRQQSATSHQATLPLYTGVGQ